MLIPPVSSCRPQTGGGQSVGQAPVPRDPPATPSPSPPLPTTCWRGAFSRYLFLILRFKIFLPHFSLYYLRVIHLLYYFLVVPFTSLTVLGSGKSEVASSGLLRRAATSGSFTPTATHTPGSRTVAQGVGLHPCCFHGSRETLSPLF